MDFRDATNSVEFRDAGGTCPNDAKKTPNPAPKSDTFDVSFVGRARAGGFRLPISHSSHSSHSSDASDQSNQSNQSNQSKNNGGLQIRNIFRLPPKNLPISDKIGSPLSKDSKEAAEDVMCGLALNDAKNPEIIRTGYILSFTIVIAVTCFLEDRGNVFALNLSILSALPLLSSTVVFHSMEMGRSRRALVGAAGTTMLAASAISIIISNGVLSLMRHIPGLFMLCLFFYLMSAGWRKIVSTLCSLVILLCLILSMVIDANFDNKQTLVMTTLFIFGVLFVQSNLSVTPVRCHKSGCLGIV